MNGRTDKIRSTRAPTLGDDQIDVLGRYGQTRETQVGQVLFRAGARRTLGARALFFFIGADANTGWLEGAVELDERGFVLTGRELDGSVLEEDAWRGLSREPYPLETSLPGVFAAGDARSGSIKRVASAVGEGSMAVRLVHHYLAGTGV